VGDVTSELPLADLAGEYFKDTGRVFGSQVSYESGSSHATC
jgi:hypothetical protein